MKAFLWHQIDKVSDNYHEGGGVIIVAETIDRAREIALVGDEKMSIDGEPDYIFDSDLIEEKVIPFPNAGCC